MSFRRPSLLIVKAERPLSSSSEDLARPIIGHVKEQKLVGVHVSFHFRDYT